MSVTTPDWSGVTTDIAAQMISALQEPKLSGAEGSIGLGSKFGAWVWCHAGRADATAITGNPIRFNIRPSANTIVHPVSPYDRVGGSTTATATTVDATSAAAGTQLNVTTTSGFLIDELIAIMTTGPSVTNLEFKRIARIDNPGAGGELILDEPLEFEHVNTDIVTNQADLFFFWLPGGITYTTGIDYGGCSAGPDIAARILYKTYDSNTST